MNESALPMIEKLLQEHTRETGTLWVDRDGQQVRLPLAAYRITARAAGCVAEVAVEQSFQNPYQEFLEAVYIFPLGGGAAVSGFEMKVGDRTLKGIVKERGEARLDYSNALDQGKRAALLEQDRDNVFTVQVGNLPPGETVSVRIVYSERLSYFEDGTTELRLPLVVAPRYIPGEPLDGVAAGQGVEVDTDAVPDASRISPPRLAPGFDPRVALTIEVELADGAAADLACSQHAVKLANGRIALSRENEHLNRDFVLRWRLGGAKVQSRLLVNRDGFAMLTLFAPRRDGFLGTPRDVVFVLDRSGSMGGVKMASAARACSMLLATLGPRDKFAVCAFSTSTEWMQWTSADESGIAAGDKFLRGIHAQGGTEMDTALKETLATIDTRQEPMGREPVIVLITDGQVGNESQIAKRVQRDTAGVRIFTVGIDTAVNAPFLMHLAALAGGTCTCCVPGEALEQVLASVARDIGRPVITELRIDGADALAPARPVDLFAGRASTSFFAGRNIKEAHVQGKFADGSPFVASIKAEEIDLPAIAHLWARARVADLEDRFRLGENVKREIIDLGVKHTLLTRFTAFVVVDEGQPVNAKGARRMVVQPVEMPDAWDMQMVQLSSPMFLGSMSAEQRRAPAKIAQKSTAQLFDGASLPPEVSLVDIFGKYSGKSAWTSDEDAPKVSRTHRAAIEKAMAALAKALKDVRAELDAGRIPPAKPLEQARQDLMKAIGKSGVRADGLQRFLRSTLVELIASLASGSAGSVRPILDRVEKEYELLLREKNFWEASV